MLLVDLNLWLWLWFRLRIWLWFCFRIPIQIMVLVLISNVCCSSGSDAGIRSELFLNSRSDPIPTYGSVSD